MGVKGIVRNYSREVNKRKKKRNLKSIDSQRQFLDELFYQFNFTKLDDFLSISKNKIQSRDIKYSIKFPTITITNTVIKNKNEYYIGLGLVGGKNGIGFFGPELMVYH